MPTSRIGRRNYLQLVGGSIATAGVAGTATTASAANRVKVTGTLKAYNGDPVAGRKIYATGHGYSPTDDSGYFELDIDSETYVSIGLYKSQDSQLHAPVKNGVPHVDKITSLETGSSDIDLGTIKVKEAYVVDIRALDNEGNPVTDAEFGFRGDGFGSGSGLSANENGYCVIDGADFSGVELTQSAKVVIQIPTGGDAVRKYEKQIYVSSPMTVIAQVGEGITVKERQPGETRTPNQTATKTTTATPTSTAPSSTTTQTATKTKTPTPTSTAPTSTAEGSSTTSRTTISPTPSKTTATSGNGSAPEVKRGFFANGDAAEEYPFLTDPMFLTVGGFTLSVAGVLQNLLRGN